VGRERLLHHSALLGLLLLGGKMLVLQGSECMRQGWMLGLLGQRVGSSSQWRDGI
jgi:hypothetical protein